MKEFEPIKLEPLSFSGFRRCILSASKANKENWYFSQTRGGYYADYRPDYPRKTNADFYIYLDNSVYPARLTMYQDTATIPTVKQYPGMDALQEDLKNMETYIKEDKHMKELTINGKHLGRCIGYRNTTQPSPTTGDDLGHFTFAMEAGYSIVVDKLQIKSFTSCDGLNIELWKEQ